ncbi:unnamed protein product [Albugo candida]|uniref:Uncharacterized protein n=1 Tax=Albugo candida TaxID=65357 RepID=A0A024GI54_9STRA|nr:unnamed protein product [Albugo candida]|eukprot:CCI46425.1 unnamed protein product [Albugo candida]
MYISRTQFYLVIQAICYIVQSSTDECEIPETGITCEEDDETHTPESTSTILFNERTGSRDVICTILDGNGGEKIVSRRIYLGPEGIGCNCATFIYIFANTKVNILRTLKTPEGISPSNEDEEFKTYDSHSKKMWMLRSYRITRGKDVLPSLEEPRHNDGKDVKYAHVSFSTANNVRAPFLHKIEDIEEPFMIQSTFAQDSALEVEYKQIEEFNTRNTWELGWEHLQQYEFQFLKDSNGILKIKYKKKKTRPNTAFIEPSTKTTSKRLMITTICLTYLRQKLFIFPDL